MTLFTTLIVLWSLLSYREVKCDFVYYPNSVVVIAVI